VEIYDPVSNFRISFLQDFCHCDCITKSFDLNMLQGMICEERAPACLADDILSIRWAISGGYDWQEICSKRNQEIGEQDDESARNMGFPVEQSD
jgi:hypothetical protein